MDGSGGGRGGGLHNVATMKHHRLSRAAFVSERVVWTRYEIRDLTLTRSRSILGLPSKKEAFPQHRLYRCRSERFSTAALSAGF